MDERLKFIRGKKFDGLEDYKNSKSINIQHKNISYPIQQKLFGESNLEFGLRARLGRFFELMSYGIYGGNIKESYNFSNGNSGSFLITEPDITHFMKRCIREVKAVSPGNSLKLSDEQIAKYSLIQIENLIKKDIVIRFEIFRHGINNLQKKFGDKQQENTLDDLVNNLSQTTKFMISSPFSLIFKMFSSNSKFCSRYDGDKYSTLTQFLSSGINNLLAYPEETMREIGANPDEYIIQKMKLKKGLKVNGKTINVFPILSIYDKNHGEWLNKFREEFASRKDFPRNFYIFYAHFSAKIEPF